MRHARLWLGIGAVALFVAAVVVSSATFEPTLPATTTLPPVSTQPLPPPTRPGSGSTTEPTTTAGPGPPGIQGPQGPPGPAGPAGVVVVLPAPTTGPPPSTTSTPVQATTTTRCRTPNSTVHPSSTLHPQCLPHS